MEKSKIVALATCILALAAAGCEIEVLPPGGLLDIQPEASGGEFADRIALAWPAVRGATAYNVYACDVDVGVYEQINEAPVGAPAFDCLEVLPYFTYFFKVSAVLSGGESPLSRSAIGWVSPSELRVDALDGGLALSWASVPGAGLYLLEAAASSDGPFYQLTEAENSLVVADGSYPYDTSCFAFAFDPAAPRQSVRLRAPASDTWFRVRAVQVVDGVSIRSRGGAVEWRKP